MLTNTGRLSVQSTGLAAAYWQQAPTLGVGSALREMKDPLADLVLPVHEHLHLQCRMIFNGMASRSYDGTTQTGA